MCQKLCLSTFQVVYGSWDLWPYTPQGVCCLVFWELCPYTLQEVYGTSDLWPHTPQGVYVMLSMLRAVALCSSGSLWDLRSVTPIPLSDLWSVCVIYGYTSVDFSVLVSENNVLTQARTNIRACRFVIFCMIYFQTKFLLKKGLTSISCWHTSSCPITEVKKPWAWSLHRWLPPGTIRYYNTWTCE